MRTAAMNVLTLPSVRNRLDADFGPRREGVAQANDFIGLFAGQVERFPGLALEELQWQDAHVDEVAAVDPLVTGGDDGADAEKVGALRRPVARAARAVFSAREDDRRHVARLVQHCRVVDRHDLLARSAASRLAQKSGHAALRAGGQEVADADVRKRAADHHPVVAPPAAVAVEIGGLDAVLHRGICRRDCSC